MGLRGRLKRLEREARKEMVEILQRDGTVSPGLMPDFGHPNLRGYQLYTAAIWKPLMALLVGE